MRRDRRGVVYLETLIAFLPVFTFFLGTLHIADLGAARLIVDHAANATARAAVVVLPDDGIYYDDQQNQLLHRYEGLRREAVEHATDLVLSASPRLSKENVELSNGSEPSLGAQFGLRDSLIAKVSAQYRCLVAMFCPGGIDMESRAELTYQGALYVYELNTNLVDNAASKGSNLVRNERQPDPQSDTDPRSDPDNNSDGRGDPDNNNDGRGDPNKNDDRPGDLATQGPKQDDARPNDAKPDAEQGKDDGPLRPDPELQAQLPKDLQNVPVVRDPNLPGSTVEVRYTTDDKGVITDIVVHAGPDAGPRHIQDHADTIRVMQRYQGAIGRARAIGRRLGELLLGRPDLGPGTRAWEAKREIDKLSAILDNRARQLENPDLTPEQRAELEREVANYERQLAEYQALVNELSKEAGTGAVAARDDLTGTGKERAQQLGWPPAPKGYHWATGPDPDGTTKPGLRRSPPKTGTGKKPQLKYDEATGTFRQDDPTAPPIQYDPATDSFRQVGDPMDATYVDAVAKAKGLEPWEVQEFYRKERAKGLDPTSLIEDAQRNHGLTQAEAEVLYGYTTKQWYRDINQAMTNGTATPEQQPLIDLLNSALSKMPSASSTTQYRGLRMTPAQVAAFDAKYAAGTDVTSDAFWSTGPTPDNAYGGDRKLVITTRQAKDISDLAFGVHFHDKIGKTPYASEQLIPNGVRFRVTRVDPATGTVYLEEI